MRYSCGVDFLDQADGPEEGRDQDAGAGEDGEGGDDRGRQAPKVTSGSEPW
jgi:hypothetical protein